MCYNLFVITTTRTAFNLVNVSNSAQNTDACVTFHLIPVVIVAWTLYQVTLDCQHYTMYSQLCHSGSEAVYI
jgi:hypothetical protein